ncbi:glycosyltransferase [Goekera deserti]|uniref:glycosyltransferase n=1 Tax=Goekera deserti TaxID=2497753 RepID=UPI00192EB0F3|nr:glycosyltransferase [Goekera deserti]
MAHVGNRPEGKPFVLIGYGVALAGSVALWGADATFGVVAGALNVVFAVYFCRHLAFAIAASRWADGDLHAADVGFDTYTPAVAVLVGCKNEALVVDGMVAALLELDYPAEQLTLVVVDDGSDDGTGERLDVWAAREPRLRVLHRPPGSAGGKSGALNDALALVDGEIVVVFDADHEPEATTIRRLVRHFRDPATGAVMGRCVIRNSKDSRMANTVFLDYLSGYLVNEYGRQAVFELPAYGGANCAVRMSTLRGLGGWNPETVTEDTDLTLRVLLSGQRVRYDVTAIDFEEAVISTQRFWKQRYRWARGHQKCMRDYLLPLMRCRHLTLVERAETALFLFVYHVPLLSGLGLLLTVLRAFGIGDLPAVAVLPLSMLLFIGPLAELCVGLLIGRVERRAAWQLLGFLPAFALSIWITSRAYVDGMLGRPYSWVKTSRSGSVSTARPTPPASQDRRGDGTGRPRSFAHPGPLVTRGDR